jgi:hypothetical protein
MVHQWMLKNSCTRPTHTTWLQDWWEDTPGGTLGGLLPFCSHSQHWHVGGGGATAGGGWAGDG